MTPALSGRASPKDACAHCPARRLGFCASLDRGEIETIAALKNRVESLPSGAEIYRQGDDSSQYFTVLEGWVALSVTLEDGREQIVDFALPGSFLGGQADGVGVMPHTARCITAVRVCPLPRQRLHELVDTHPDFAMRLIRLTACHEARAQDHLTNIGRRSARERLAHLLLELYYRNTHRLPLASGDAIDLPLTLEHLGDALGLTGVHVSRTLRVLREQGAVVVEHRRLTVLNPDAFMRAAGFEGLMIDYDLGLPIVSEKECGAGTDR